MSPAFFFFSCKIEQSKSDQQIVFGRHFDASSQLVSKITRESIDLLKANFKDDLSEADWRLVVKLKKVGTQGEQRGRAVAAEEARDGAMTINARVAHCGFSAFDYASSAGVRHRLNVRQERPFSFLLFSHHKQTRKHSPHPPPRNQRRCRQPHPPSLLRSSFSPHLPQHCSVLFIFLISSVKLSTHTHDNQLALNYFNLF